MDDYLFGGLKAREEGDKLQIDINNLHSFTVHTENDVIYAQ